MSGNKGFFCSIIEGFEGSFILKTFQGLLFWFLWHSVGTYVFDLFGRETNLKKISLAQKLNSVNFKFSAVKSFPA